MKRCSLQEEATEQKLSPHGQSGLRYVHDSETGIRRVRSGKGFRYSTPDNTALSEGDRQRIEALVIPPAWENVWICTDPRGHIQATGRDDKGRKQYRYHAQWTALQGETKFAGLTDFARGLSPLRAAIEVDLRRRAMGREKVIATAVSLMDKLLIRVGNQSYAKKNKSFGLTTLRKRHVRGDGRVIRFIFLGKSGKKWNLQLSDRRISRLIRSIQELPGQHLFQYLDDSEQCCPITSDDINAYLREASRSDFTSRHFRTWAATVQALDGLRRLPRPDNAAQCRRVLNIEIDRVAGLLGNTRTVCRSSYIHPAVISSWTEDRLAGEIRQARSIRVVAPGLDSAERLTLKWLEHIGTSE